MSEKVGGYFFIERPPQEMMEELEKIGYSQKKPKMTWEELEAKMRASIERDKKYQKGENDN